MRDDITPSKEPMRPPRSSATGRSAASDIVRALQWLQRPLVLYMPPSAPPSLGPATARRIVESRLNRLGSSIYALKLAPLDARRNYLAPKVEEVKTVGDELIAQSLNRMSKARRLTRHLQRILTDINSWRKSCDEGLAQARLALNAIEATSANEPQSLWLEASCLYAGDDRKRPSETLATEELQEIARDKDQKTQLRQMAALVLGKRGVGVRNPSLARWQQLGSQYRRWPVDVLFAVAKNDGPETLLSRAEDLRHRPEASHALYGIILRGTQLNWPTIIDRLPQQIALWEAIALTDNNKQSSDAPILTSGVFAARAGLLQMDQQQYAAALHWVEICSVCDLHVQRLNSHRALTEIAVIQQHNPLPARTLLQLLQQQAEKMAPLAELALRGNLSVARQLLELEVQPDDVAWVIENDIVWGTTLVLESAPRRARWLIQYLREQHGDRPHNELSAIAYCVATLLRDLEPADLTGLMRWMLIMGDPRTIDAADKLVYCIDDEARAHLRAIMPGIVRRLYPIGRRAHQRGVSRAEIVHDGCKTIRLCAEYAAVGGDPHQALDAFFWLSRHEVPDEQFARMALMRLTRGFPTHAAQVLKSAGTPDYYAEKLLSEAALLLADLAEQQPSFARALQQLIANEGTVHVFVSLLQRLGLAKRLGGDDVKQQFTQALCPPTQHDELPLPDDIPESCVADMRTAQQLSGGALSDRITQILRRPQALRRELEALNKLQRDAGGKGAAKRITAIEAALSDPAKLQQWMETDLRKALTSFLATQRLERLRNCAAHIIQQHVRRVIGSEIPADGDRGDWDNAIRLFTTVEQNSGILTRLMRAEASGSRDWLEKHPDNLRFRKRMLARRVDFDAYRAPMGRDVRTPAGKWHISLENDPLKVLQMGNHFNTCLSEGDIYSYAVIANACEANKRVVYVRDEKKRVVGRRLLVMTDEGFIAGFETYANQKYSPPWQWLKLSIDAFAFELAAKCRARLFPHDKPHSGEDAGETPNHRAWKLFAEWYNDGLRRFDPIFAKYKPAAVREQALAGEGPALNWIKSDFHAGGGAWQRALLWLGDDGARITEQLMAMPLTEDQQARLNEVREWLSRGFVLFLPAPENAPPE